VGCTSTWGDPATLGFSKGFCSLRKIRTLSPPSAPHMHSTKTFDWTPFSPTARGNLWPEDLTGIPTGASRNREGVNARTGLQPGCLRHRGVNAFEECRTITFRAINKREGEKDANTPNLKQDREIARVRPPWQGQFGRKTERCDRAQQLDENYNERRAGWRIIFEYETKNGDRMLMDGNPRGNAR